MRGVSPQEGMVKEKGEKSYNAINYIGTRAISKRTTGKHTIKLKGFPFRFNDRGLGEGIMAKASRTYYTTFVYYGNRHFF